MVRVVKTGVDIDGTVHAFGASQAMVTTGLVTKRGPSNIAEGAHKIRRIEKLEREWKPESASGKRFIERVTSEVEKTLSGLPDHDTGYFKIENGAKSYPIKHGLSSVPSRTKIFFSNDTEITDSTFLYDVSPGLDYNSIGSESGVQLLHAVSGNESYIISGFTTIYNQSFDSGLLRVLFWR